MGPAQTIYGRTLLSMGMNRSLSYGKFELWEVKFLGYMKIRKLKHVFVTQDEQNEMAFS